MLNLFSEQQFRCLLFFRNITKKIQRGRAKKAYLVSVSANYFFPSIFTTFVVPFFFEIFVLIFFPLLETTLNKLRTDKDKDKQQNDSDDDASDEHLPTTARASVTSITRTRPSRTGAPRDAGEKDDEKDGDEMDLKTVDEIFNLVVADPSTKKRGGEKTSRKILNFTRGERARGKS